MTTAFTEDSGQSCHAFSCTLYLADIIIQSIIASTYFSRHIQALNKGVKHVTFGHYSVTICSCPI